MTRLGIEPRSPGPFAILLLIRPIAQYIYIYIYTERERERERESGYIYIYIYIYVSREREVLNWEIEISQENFKNNLVCSNSLVNR